MPSFSHETDHDPGKERQQQQQLQHRWGEIKSLHFIEVADIQANMHMPLGAASQRACLRLLRLRLLLPALECSATQNVFYAGSGFVRETVAKVLARNARGNTISALGPCGSFALLMLLASLLLPQLLLLWHCVWRLCGFGVCLAARDMTWQKAVWHKQRVVATVACLQNFRHSAAL